MKRLIALSAAACMFALGGALPAQAAPLENQVCESQDSGKIDVEGDVSTITLTAPEGMLITSVCLKGGSAKQGLGTEYFSFTPGVTTVTLSLASGMDISHYSVAYGTDEEEPPYQS